MAESGEGSWGRTMRRVLIGLMVTLALIVTFQNTTVVVFRFLLWQVSISLVLLIPLVLLVGFVIGLLAYRLMVRRDSKKMAGQY